MSSCRGRSRFRSTVPSCAFTATDPDLSVFFLSFLYMLPRPNFYTYILPVGLKRLRLHRPGRTSRHIHLKHLLLTLLTPSQSSAV